MNRTLRVIIWILVILFTGLAFVVLMPSLLGLVLIALLVFGVVDFAMRRRRNTTDAFNSVLKTVIEKGGNLTSVAVAFSQSGPISSQAYEFARRLMMGQEPLEAAARSRIPLQLTTAIAMQQISDGQEIQQPEATNKLQESNSGLGAINAAGTSVTSVHGRLMYLFVTASVTLMVLSFMAVFIMPKMEQFFEEFAMDTSSFVNQLSIKPAIVAYIAILMLAISFTLLSKGHLFGWQFPGWLPTLPAVARRKSELLHGLADAVDAHWPIGRALAIAHTISIEGGQRRRLQKAMEWIEQGRSPAEAIQSAGWIEKTDVGWLENAPASRMGSLLRMIGERGVRDSVFNLGWTVNLFFPFLVLILAGVVTAYAQGFVKGLYDIVLVLANQW